MTTEERFNAAVNVIKGLPKNGPYQPSTKMLLKFYALYKQATEDFTNVAKPPFWDLKGRAKWDAWYGKRNLSKEQAMQEYVRNLQDIIETMSFTENVQNFVGVVSGLEKINLDELDLISPGIRQLAISHPNSPFHSRNNSPLHAADEEAIASNIFSDQEEAVIRRCDIDEVANDVSVDNNELSHHIEGETEENKSDVPSIGDRSEDEYDDAYDLERDALAAIGKNGKLLEKINATVTRMNSDIVLISERIENLEKTVQDLRLELRNSRTRQQMHWWIFQGAVPLCFFLLVLTPSIIRRLRRATHPSKH